MANTSFLATHSALVISLLPSTTPTSSSSASDSSGRSPPVQVLAGIVVGAALGITLLVVCVCIIYNHWKERRPSLNQAMSITKEEKFRNRGANSASFDDSAFSHTFSHSGEKVV